MNILREYICTKDNSGCVGYNNGRCITFENCMYKKEKVADKSKDDKTESIKTSN